MRRRSMDILLDRRSIRKYRTEGVPKDNIDRILESAMAAPSAMNRRPCHFVVITDRDVIGAIPKIHPYAAMASRAPLAIVVCADSKVQTEPGYYSQDCSAAMQNMLLACTGLGLGSVWCGIYPRKERIEGFSRLLKVPENIVPFSLMIAGYPDEKKEPHKGIDEDRVHLNSW
ncbi:MAG: nitroreductase family protein [Candidatus Thermoplasmatota archaeon]|nr:nitroreductase family protein [Candidatus Thermoplasmatota archaeon]